MAIDIKQSVKHSQNLLMSAQIQQAIKILTLGRQDLEEFISEELKENPCLEEGDPNQDEGEPSFSNVDLNNGEDASALKNMELELKLGNDLLQDVRGLDELFARFDDNASTTGDKSDDFDTPMYDRIQSENTDLIAELEEQLSMMHLTEYELSLCLELLQYVDDNGFIPTSLAEISVGIETTPDDIKYALSVIQKCEPIGVGAKDTRECLLLQMKSLENAPLAAERILKDAWPEFEKQDLPKICKIIKASPEETRKAATWIKENLDPRPARQYSTATSQLITPDVFIFKRDGVWIVSLNEEGLPRIKVSQQYAKLIASYAEQKKKVEKDFVNERVKSARWVVRALAERNKTILRVTESILTRQTEFFEHGVEFLKPLTLKIIAAELELHESTISRTTTNKFLHSPRGIFELKYFFNSGMENSDGSSMANEAIKNYVAEYIKAEEPNSPYSDQELADLIEKEKGVKVARRTVSKYRESLGIGSSSKRNKKF